MPRRLSALLVLSIGFFAATAGAALAPAPTAPAAPAGKNTLPPEVRTALRAAKSVELYSLEPWFDPSTEETQWHDTVLLGHAPLSSADTKLAVAQLETAVSGWKGENPDCFDARHGIVVKSGERSYDLVISFDCQVMEIYRDGAKITSLHVANSPAPFNELLKKVNLPLSASSTD